MLVTFTQRFGVVRTVDRTDSSSDRGGWERDQTDTSPSPSLVYAPAAERASGPEWVSLGAELAGGWGQGLLSPPATEPLPPCGKDLPGPACWGQVGVLERSQGGSGKGAGFGCVVSQRELREGAPCGGDRTGPEDVRLRAARMTPSQGWGCQRLS